MNKNKLAIALLLTLSLAFVISALAQQTSADTAADPVCGMTLKKSEAKATFDYKGTTYYFCSAGCKDAFVKDPEKYLQKKDEAASEKPGTCPRSGKQMPMAGMGHGQMAGACPMMPRQQRHGQMAGPAAGMSCPLNSKDVEMKTETLPDGAMVKFTSKNPESVKAIQEHLDKMKACCSGAGCEPQKDVKK